MLKVLQDFTVKHAFRCLVLFLFKYDTWQTQFTKYLSSRLFKINVFYTLFSKENNIYLSFVAYCVVLLFRGLGIRGVLKNWMGREKGWVVMGA